MLPTGTDRGGWYFNYTDTGYLMANNMPNNERSLRRFTVPESSIRNYQRPFTYSVKVYVRPNEKFIHPEFGANAGLVYAVDPKNPKWQVIMVRADGSVMTASFAPRENRGAGQLSNQLFYMKTGAEAGKATEIKVVESEKDAVVSINGQKLIRSPCPRMEAWASSPSARANTISASSRSWTRMARSCWVLSQSRTSDGDLFHFFGL